MDKVLRVNIVHWNAQSIRHKLVDFELFLSRDKVHIAAVSETWLDQNISCSVKDYTVYRQDRPDSYRGIVLLIHKSIKSQLCSVTINNSGIQVLMVKIHNCDFIENFISIYCPSSVPTSQDDWDVIFSLASNKTLIIGDFNAHHSNWSYKTDSRGSRIYEAMAENNYVTLNDGSPTRLKMVSGVLQKSAPEKIINDL